VSVPIRVEAYSGYKSNERPRRFCLDENVVEISTVEDRWYDPNAEYFKVRAADGRCFLLRCNSRTGEWTLQSGFDGAEILSRTSITLVTVEPEAIRAGEKRIKGCEQCRPEHAELPFDSILAEMLGKRGAHAFILSEPGKCPKCDAELSEKTLVQPQGGIEWKSLLPETGLPSS
jgi:hypothetical protein